MKLSLYIAAGIAALALITLPFFSDLGIVNLSIKIMIAAIFALGFNLLWGQTALPSFGHAAYYGIGTFATIFVMDNINRGGWFPTPLLPLVGASAGFVFGLVAGWFATIRSGVYFAMITVALAELTSAIAFKWEAVFGGEGGIRSIRTDWGPLEFQSTTSVYWLTLAWMVLVIAFLWALQNGPFGLVVRGIRERELRVRFLGYNAHVVKTVVFALSAAISGLAGALLAISDESASMVLFSATGSAFVVLNTVIGGAGVFFGPVIGAVLTTAFGYFGATLSHYWMLYLGIAFVVTVMYAPQGIGGVILQRYENVKAGRRSALDMSDLLGAIAFILASSGIVFLVELTGEICSDEYRASVNAGHGIWPPVNLFGHLFDPLSPLTWLVGIVSLAAGVLIASGYCGLKSIPLFAVLSVRTRGGK